MEQKPDYNELSPEEKKHLEQYLGCKNGESEKIIASVVRTITLRLDQRTVEKLGQIALEKEQSISDTILEAIQFFLIFF